MKQKLKKNKKIINSVPSEKLRQIPTTRKKIIFYAVLVVLPFSLVLLLELTLRLFSYGDDLSLFMPSSDPKYLKCNQIVGKRFFSKIEFTTPLNDLFLEEKPVNGYRIFVLGESTVQGFPYDVNLAFSRILQRRLQDIFPDRTIEIINLGMTAISSYTLLDFVDELLQQKPDAVLIYAGHNEYYGVMGVASMENGTIPGWLKKLHLRLVHLKTYQLLQSFINEIYKIIYPLNKDDANMTLMQQMVGKNIIPYESEMYKEGLVQFQDNMNQLLTKLKKAKVPTIISDLVSNEKDLPPFYSISYRNLPPADFIYFEAEKLEVNSLFVEAKEKYIKAKDLDAIRFRASEDLNKIISNLVDSFGIYQISLKSFFEKYSSHGIVGNNLMADHLHPNIDGYFLIAECFFNALKENKMIQNNWDTTRIKPWTYYRNNWGFTELDSMVADLRIKHLKAGWPFKPDTTINNFIYTYKPKGIIDSLAFMTVKYNNVSIEKVHKDLAEYYNSKGDLKRASKEYLSLAYLSPQNASYYYFAADLAYKAKDYDNTIRILKETPNSDTNTYALFTLSSVYFSQKKFKEALLNIDKHQKNHLYEKNYLMGEELKFKIQRDSGLNYEAEKTLASIKKLNPGFNENNEGTSRVILIPEKVKPYIEKAELLRKRGKLQEALVVLTEANKIRETAYVDMVIGKILMSQRNTGALSYLEKAYREYKDDPSLSYSLCILYLMKEDFHNAQTAINNFARTKGENNPQFKQLKVLFEKQLEKKK